MILFAGNIILMNFDLSNVTGNTPEKIDKRYTLFEIQYPMVSSEATGGLLNPPVLHYSIQRSVIILRFGYSKGMRSSLNS